MADEKEETRGDPQRAAPDADAEVPTANWSGEPEELRPSEVATQLQELTSELEARRAELDRMPDGPRFDGKPGTAQYRDVIEVVGDDERLLHGNVLGDDGQWTRFMTARYRRVPVGGGR